MIISPLAYIHWLKRHWLVTLLFLAVSLLGSILYARSISGLHQATSYTQFQSEASNAGYFDDLTALMANNDQLRQTASLDLHKNDLKLAEYADGYDFVLKIAHLLSTKYADDIEIYKSEIAAYGTDDTNALEYFVRYHFRVIRVKRIKEDGFFIFRWHFYSRSLTQQMLTDILDLLRVEIDSRREHQYTVALNTLASMSSAAPTATQQAQATLTGLYEAKLSASKSGAAPSMLHVFPVEVSSGYTYPRVIAVVLITFAACLIAGLTALNILLVCSRSRSQ